MSEFRVTVFESGVKLQSFTFSKFVVTIGRSSEADVRIQDKTVSRQQAELLRTSQGFALFAHPSTNVTRVRGEQVPPDGTVPLVPGDPIQIADRYLLELELLDVPAGPAPAGEAPAAASPEAAPAPEAALAEPAAPAPQAAPASAPAPSRPASPRAGGGGSQAPVAETGRPNARTTRLDPAAAAARGAGAEPPRPAAGPPPRPAPGAPPAEATSPRREAASPPPPPAAAQTAPRAPSQTVPAAPSAGGPLAPPAGGSLPILGETGGAPVPIPPPVKVEVVATARRRQGPAGARLLYRVNGSERALEVHDDFYIGGGADNDLHLSGGYAPRRAALVVRVEGRYRVYNTSPLPETLLVNGKGIQGYADLVSGDELQVYGVGLTFSAG